MSESASNSAPERPDDAAAERARAEDFRSKYLYAAAEVENTRKRMQRDADEASRALKKRLLLSFLPVLDNLERALAHPESEDLRAGLEATVRGFESALQSAGVKPISAAGKRFDPNVAEAIGTEPAANVDDETVLSEARRGYYVDDELLRPAHVVVAKNT